MNLSTAAVGDPTPRARTRPCPLDAPLVGHGRDQPQTAAMLVGRPWRSLQVEHLSSAICDRDEQRPWLDLALERYRSCAVNDRVRHELADREVDVIDELRGTIGGEDIAHEVSCPGRGRVRPGQSHGMPPPGCARHAGASLDSDWRTQRQQRSSRSHPQAKRLQCPHPLGWGNQGP